MLCVYDFDGTLYRTGKMWEFWISALEQEGYQREKCEQKGPLVFWEGFTPTRHLLEIDPECAQEKVEKLTKLYQDHIQKQHNANLYPEVERYLAEREVGQQVIMTHGDPEFQRFKVGATGVDKFVSEIRISRPENRKVDQLAALAKEHKEEIIYVENNPRELREVLEAKLPISLVRMVREGERHADKPCPEDDKEWKVVTSLREI
jgi:phosphoglycolate phosphatase-like HAD superfamily hydrolase